LGRGADEKNVLWDEGERARHKVELHPTGRGGDVTYHGPGQLVGYPIVELRRRDVHLYLRDLEEVLIRTLADFGIRSDRVTGYSGVWIGDAKIAAIGVRVSRWVTSHGFALNVHPDLSYFSSIIPCGIQSGSVTSMEKFLSPVPSVEEVAKRVAVHFGEVFQLEMV
jgi:lipoate-protein ligase B